MFEIAIYTEPGPIIMLTNGSGDPAPKNGHGSI